MACMNSYMLVQNEIYWMLLPTKQCIISSATLIEIRASGRSEREITSLRRKRLKCQVGGGQSNALRAWFNFQELHGKASRKAKVTVEGRGVRTFDDAKPNKDFYDIFKLSGWAFKGFNSSSLSGFSKSWGYRSRSSSEPGIDGDPPRSTIVRRSPSSAALSSTLNKRTPRKIYFLGFSKEMQKIRYNF